MRAPDSAAFDRHMMAIALRMARRGLGRTAPNPAVGAVIADETTGEVISRGWTQPGGRPHAETEALRRAGARAGGATLYVTLEPCSHQGQTPPCADAIIAAGIGRVVTAMEDPDPRVSGRGLARLRDAGVIVTRGVLAGEAHWNARGHIVRVTERRPFVQLKLALDPAGRPGRGGGSPRWVTGPQARAHGHLLRAQSDAILAGRQSVLDDDPLLTCRLPGLHDRSPIRVILSRRPAAIAQSRVVRTAAEVPVYVFGETGAGSTSLAAMPGVRVFEVPAVAERLWLPAVAETLAAEGITRLLVEGGPMIWRTFADARLIDEVVLFHAWPDARQGLSEAEARRALANFVPAGGLEFAGRRSLDSDDMIVFRRV